MKKLTIAHLVTAILGWIIVVVASPIVISEGGLAAAGTLCIVGVATAISFVDILSVFFAKKGLEPVLPMISVIFWGLIFVFYGITMVSPGQEWQGRLSLGILILIALFKIIASISLVKEGIRPNSQKI
jgi:hypothetical protein